MNTTHQLRNHDDDSVSKLALMALCGIGLVAAIAAQQPANADAAHAAEVRKATVSIADLDTSTPQGMRAARDRLHATARRLCLQVADPKDRSAHDNYLLCMDEAMTAALQQLQSLAPPAVAKVRGQEPNSP